MIRNRWHAFGNHVIHVEKARLSACEILRKCYPWYRVLRQVACHNRYTHKTDWWHFESCEYKPWRMSGGKQDFLAWDLRPAKSWTCKCLALHTHQALYQFPSKCIENWLFKSIDANIIADAWDVVYLANKSTGNIEMTWFGDKHVWYWHYCDVIMGPMASQITSLTSLYSSVYSGAD